MWSRGGVVWIKTRSDRIKVRSDRIKMRSDRIKVRSKGDQNAEQGGAKDMCFYLIPNWSLALRQAQLNTGLWRYRIKDYTKKIKSWKDRTIN